MRSWAVIDLDRLVANYRAVSRAAGPAVTLLNVIKADAYGHGSAAVCRALEAAGAAHFAVSNLDEAAALRNAGSKAALVVLNGLEQREAPDAAALGAQPFLNTKQQLDQWSAHGRKLGWRLPCHLKLNTGMNRSGFDFDPACPTRKASFLNMLHEAAGIAAAGVATHFASAENFASPAAAEQLDLFAQQVAALASSGIRPRYVHAANSAALAYRRDEPAAAGLQCTMARPGLALYGYLIDSAPRGRKAAFAVSPILQWKTRLLEIRRVRAGAAVGYGAAYRAVRDMQIGVAAAGYADGFRRALSNRGAVAVRGARCNVIGSVSMDLTLVDLSAAPAARIGDEITLLGPGAGDAKTIAGRIGTIPYEVLCGISERVERRYEAAAPPVESEE